MSSRSGAGRAGDREPEVVRWYTAGWRIPTLIGKTARGERLPGGPYTVAQLVGAVAMAAGCIVTAPLWKTDNLVLNVFVVVMLSGGTLVLLGRYRGSPRMLLAAARGLRMLLLAPALGVWGGREIRAPRRARLRRGAQLARWPRPTVTTATVTALADTAPATPMPALASQRVPQGSAAGATSRRRRPAPAGPMTGVEALLQRHDLSDNRVDDLAEVAP